MSARPLYRLLLLGVIVAACASGPSPSVSSDPTPSATQGASSLPTSSPGPTPDDATIYRGIAAQVEAIRSLQATAQVEPKVIDRATLAANLTAEFDKDNAPATIS
jgi:hypothetical protein